MRFLNYNQQIGDDHLKINVNNWNVKCIALYKFKWMGCMFDLFLLSKKMTLLQDFNIL